MSSIISFITGKSTYIFIGIILVMAIALSSIHADNVKSRGKITQLEHEVTSLEKDNVALRTSIEYIRELREKENEELEKARNRISDLQSSKENSLKEVDNAYKNSGNSNKLPADVVRMLNKVCEDIRGNPCPSAR